MKKYKLLKDLPGLRKGDFVWIQEYKGTTVQLYTRNCSDHGEFWVCTLDVLNPELEKYFEEVKGKNWEEWIKKKKNEFWDKFDIEYMGDHCDFIADWQFRFMYQYVLEEYCKKQGMQLEMRIKRSACSRVYFFLGVPNDAEQGYKDMASVFQALEGLKDG